VAQVLSERMKSIRKLIYGETLASITAVTLGFLALFLFFDLVDELQSLGKGNALEGGVYQLRHALLFVTLLLPSRLYELLPISVLIGTIIVMARLAQSSEYTILRTSGLGPWRALRILVTLGSFFVLLSFLVGDYVAPAADRASQLLKARYQGRITVGQTGAWLREKQDLSSFVVNVQSLTPQNHMQGVQIYEFDGRNRVVSVTQAEQARFGKDDAWELEQVHRTEFTEPPSRQRAPDKAGESALPDKRLDVRIQRSKFDGWSWPTQITAEMVSVALLRPDRMRTVDLFSYIRHLEANGQTAQRYEIEFWKKVFYPLSCLVMVVLALPFAYLHMRSGGIASYVFGGVMIGISFFLLNNVFGYIGNLRQWEPWLAAAAPGLLYSAISLTAFGWLVLRR
jgi:lipopolysaccharide export system permease protein